MTPVSAFPPSPARGGRPYGFSLVEVAMAMAILSVAMTAILGLLPYVLDNLRVAGNITAEVRIVSEVTGRIELSDWGSPGAAPYGWTNLPAILSARWYYDDQANRIISTDPQFAQRLTYIAEAQLTPASGGNAAGALVMPFLSGQSPGPTTHGKAIYVRVASSADAAYVFSNPARYSTYTAIVAKQF
jgi:uncharacterized protein (TIGR02598 family)